MSTPTLNEVLLKKLKDTYGFVENPNFNDAERASFTDNTWAKLSKYGYSKIVYRFPIKNITELTKITDAFTCIVINIRKENGRYIYSLKEILNFNGSNEYKMLNGQQDNTGKQMICIAVQNMQGEYAVAAKSIYDKSATEITLDQFSDIISELNESNYTLSTTDGAILSSIMTITSSSSPSTTPSTPTTITISLTDFNNLIKRLDQLELLVQNHESTLNDHNDNFEAIEKVINNNITTIKENKDNIDKLLAKYPL